MNTRSKGTARITRVDPRPAGAESRLKELGINVPSPPEPGRSCASTRRQQTLTQVPKWT